MEGKYRPWMDNTVGRRWACHAITALGLCHTLILEAKCNKLINLSEAGDMPLLGFDHTHTVNDAENLNLFLKLKDVYMDLIQFLDHSDILLHSN